MALLETLIDNFNDNSINTSLWDTGGNVSETGSQLVLTTDTTSSGSNYVISDITYDLTGSYAFVELVDAGSRGSNDILEIDFRLGINSGTFDIITFALVGSTLYAVKRVSGVSTTLASVTYNSTNHRWLQFRESSGTVYWETSADGRSWNTLHSAATPITITGLNVILIAFNGDTADTVAFDNLSHRAESITADVQTVTFNAVTPSVAVSQTISAGIQSVVASIGAVAVLTSQILSLSPTGATFSVLPPSVSAVDSNGAQPIGLLLSLTKVGNGINVGTSPVEASFSVQDPNVVTDQILSAGVQTASFSIQAPTVAIPILQSAGVQSATLTLQAPSVIIDVAASIEVQSSGFSVQDVTVLHNAVASAGVQTATFSVLDPDIILIDVIRPAVITGTFSLQAPIVTGEAITSADVQTLTFSQQAPSITGESVATPDVQTLTFNALAPTVTGEASVALETQTATFSLPDLLRAGSLWNNELPNSAPSWTNGSKSSSTWANSDKNSATWTNQNKNSSSWSNESKNDSSWANTDKSQTS